MNNESTGANKKIGVGLFLQVLLLAVALILTIVAIVKSRDVNRLIIYIGQAVTCALFIFYFVCHLKKSTTKHFKWTIYSYAVLEALRASLLHTENVPAVAGYLARFILIAATCTCILFADRCDEPGSIKMVYGILALEIIVYAIFLIAFPGVLLGNFNRFLPFVGVLIAGSLILFQKTRITQMNS